MPPVPTAQPDGEKIHALIKERDSRTYAVERFARRIGRHPHSVWNLIQGRTAGTAFLRQVARELGVRPSDISDASDDEPETQPRRFFGPGDDDSEPEAGRLSA
jgi:hypothetical protein